MSVVRNYPGTAVETLSAGDQWTSTRENCETLPGKQARAVTVEQLKRLLRRTDRAAAEDGQTGLACYGSSVSGAWVGGAFGYGYGESLIRCFSSCGWVELGWVGLGFVYAYIWRKNEYMIICMFQMYVYCACMSNPDLTTTSLLRSAFYLPGLGGLYRLIVSYIHSENMRGTWGWVARFLGSADACESSEKQTSHGSGRRSSHFGGRVWVKPGPKGLVPRLPGPGVVVVYVWLVVGWLVVLVASVLHRRTGGRVRESASDGWCSRGVCKVYHYYDCYESDR